MPNRILGIICTSAGWGGLEMNTLRLAGWLKEIGWKVHLISVAGTPIGAHAAAYVSSASTLGDSGLPGKSGQLRLLHAWVRRFKIHALLVPYNKDIAVASLYKRFYDGDMAFVYQQHMQVGVRKRDIIHTLRYAMIDVWIAPLQYLREETLRLTRMSADDIEVIPFGVDIAPLMQSTRTRASARGELSLPAGAYIIGVLGRLDPKKGQDLVVKSLRELQRDEGADYHLLLMGDATYREGDAFPRQLRQLIAETGLENRVHLRPYSADVMAFYRAVDVLAMPSHGETFGMVTIEAMAAGVPVIGTARDGTRELLAGGKLGYLFEKDDVAGFCRQLKALQSDPELPQRLTAAQAAVVEQYSKEKMLRSMNDLLLELIRVPVVWR